jgi:sterol desaturase/sphingolipid hydroxylase (fatty acid hydroxylase superfamily)
MTVTGMIGGPGKQPLRAIFWAWAVVSGLFRGVERVAEILLVSPFNWALRKLDRLSYRFEGTRLRRVISVSLFPTTMVVGIYLAFQAVEHGVSLDMAVMAVAPLAILGLIFAPLERLMPYSRKWLHHENDSTVDVLLMASAGLWAPFIGPLQVFLTAWLVAIIHQHLPPDLIKSFWPTSLPALVQVFLLIVVMDFFRYWYHRWMHESPIGWRWHAVHHSSQRLYWLNGVRSHPIEGLVSGVIWVVPFTLIQAPPEIVFVAGVTGRIIGRFQHTNVDVDMGVFDYIFSSAKNHRYHHSKKIEEGNSNYGGDVILWDHLFGTFYLPKGKQPSDDIGLADMPHYPQSLLGLTVAPFIHGRLQKQERARTGQAADAAPA